MRPVSVFFFCILVMGPTASASDPLSIPNDQEAWKHLPATAKGGDQPLPTWIRALSRSLPRTAAAMIELDYAQRAESPLPAPFRALLRWAAADANRCGYAKAYARADYIRAGGRAEVLESLTRVQGSLTQKERHAMDFVRKLTEAAYSVTDAEVARLVELFGEEQVVAIVCVAAYANFQDRLLTALGVEVEPGGPLAPVRVRFDKPFVPANKEASKRTLNPPSSNPPAVPERLDDLDWAAVPYAELRKRLEQQIERPRARITIPTEEEVRKKIPPGLYPSDRPMRIRWSLLTYGYQPRLTAAWLNGLRAFRSESDLDTILGESMFWVVTRSQKCFY